MQKAEYHNTASAVQTLFVFDFDDTHASTSAEIGIQRLLSCGKTDQSFGNWLEERNIVYHKVTRPKTNPFYWLSSANFALYESCSHNQTRSLQESRVIMDYSHVGKSDPGSILAIPPMMTRLRSAISRKNSQSIILTARSSLKETYSPALKKNVESDNKKLIQEFLRSHGIRFPLNKIYAVGDSPIHSSIAKASVVLDKICKIQPAEVLFFDDNILNLEAVSALSNIPFATNIVSYQVYGQGHIRKFDKDLSI